MARETVFHGLPKKSFKINELEMARITNTRELVRKTADALAAEGVKPSFSLVRERIGAGSPNTIVDELKRWNASRTEGAVAPSGSAALEATHPPVRDQERRAANPGEDNGAIDELLGRIEKLCKTVERLDAMTESAVKAITRFDDMQKRALLLVDEARGRGRYWEEEARRLRTESREKEESYRQAMYQAVEQQNVMRGQLEEARSSAAQALATLKAAGRAG